MPFQNQEKVKIEWSPNFAYAIGLITSDGCLSSDGRHIQFVSKDLELVEKFKIALAITNKIFRVARGGETFKKYYRVGLGDKVFYRFLNSIGLTSAKSKTIQSVSVPNEFFADFLRGLFDGDGTIYSYWDTRWPKSFCFKISFASASLNFTNWLKEKLTNLYGVKGILHKGKGVWNLEYTKGDSKILSTVMYCQANLLFLERKYLKVKEMLEQDKLLGLPMLQKQRMARVILPG